MISGFAVYPCDVLLHSQLTVSFISRFLSTFSSSVAPEKSVNKIFCHTRRNFFRDNESKYGGDFFSYTSRCTFFSKDRKKIQFRGEKSVIHQRKPENFLRILSKPKENSVKSLRERAEVVNGAFLPPGRL